MSIAAEALSEAYVCLLQVQESVRYTHRFQRTLAIVRDALAAIKQKSPQEVQDEYEHFVRWQSTSN